MPTAGGERAMAEPDLFERALPYYVVALGLFFENHNPSRGRNADWDSIREYWQVDPFKSPETSLLSDRDLFDAALQIIQEAGLVEVLTDDFAPDIYLKDHNFADKFEQLRARFPLFQKAYKGGKSWLFSALAAIEEELGRADQITEPADAQDWEPLAIDRESETLRELTRRIDATIEAVRQENGYASNHPEERRWVSEALGAVATRLREDRQISVMYLREFGFKPLKVLIERFGKAAVGLAAAAANKAMMDWLKEIGIRILKSLS